MTVKYPYRVLFEHRQALQKYGDRLKSFMKNELRYEGHFDGNDLEEYKRVQSDLERVTNLMLIAHSSSKLVPEEKERLIDARIGDLHFKLGSF